MRIKVKRLDHCFALPVYATLGSVGADVYATGDVVLPHCQPVVIKLGFCVEIPPGWEMQIRPRSSLSKRGIVTHLGTIDQDYRGEVCVTLERSAQAPYYCVRRGDRIAQIVLAPVAQAVFEQVGELGETERGEKGFGSTGI